ncbi:MAG: SurA N-terminal domain-containing protein [Bacteroidales bacterium]|jgi:parvulin-like peptidyl-prolyl isomerase|nr:SurA N-terminal domain-containing protein [Bacteroidales bacterium]
MAIIGKIRKHSGLTILFVGVALFAFVIGDLSRGGFGGQNNKMGVILGEDIPYIEFEKAVEEQLALNRMSNPNQNVSATETFNIRNQVWATYVEDITLGTQCDKLGLAISPDEMYDLTTGENPHQYIVYNFSDPNTGQIDREAVLNLMGNLDQLTVEGQMQVSNLFTMMKKDALRNKYRTLLNKSYYAPSAFAEMQYQKSTESVSIEIVQLPYSAIADSTIILSEADYQKYYNEHKESYKQEESRDLEYIIFDVKPSAEDVNNARDYISGLYNELARLPIEDIPLFVNTNTDGDFYDSTWVTLNALSPYIAGMFEVNESGVTTAPYQDGDAFYTSRLLATAMRSDTMDAEHILINYRGRMQAPDTARTREVAQALADSLADVIRKPNSMPFSLLALQYSDDPGKMQNSGKYERFEDGAMVPEFNEAVQNGKTGDVVVVETIFGFHVIKIGNKSEPQKKYRVATIRRDIEPGEVTVQEAYMKATKLASENRTNAAFHTTAEENNYNIRTMPSVQAMSSNLTSVNSAARQVIRWAYGKDVKIGDVSGIFEGEDQFVVASLTGINPKGYASLESRKQIMEGQLKRDKKAEMILNQVKGETGTNVHDIAAKYNGFAPENSIRLTFNTMSLPENMGRESEVIGSALGLADGQFYGPIKGFNGVYFIKNVERIPGEPKENYNDEQNQMIQGFASRSSLYQNILEEKANIKDNRVIFY